MTHGARLASRTASVRLAEQDRGCGTGPRSTPAARARPRARAARAWGVRGAGRDCVAAHRGAARLAEIPALYGELATLTGSPVVELNAPWPSPRPRGRRRAWTSSTRCRSSTTAICTPRGPSCCAGSVADEARGVRQGHRRFLRHPRAPLLEQRWPTSQPRESGARRSSRGARPAHAVARALGGRQVALGGGDVVQRGEDLAARRASSCRRHGRRGAACARRWR